MVITSRMQKKLLRKCVWILAATVYIFILIQSDLVFAEIEPDVFIPPLCGILACTGEVTFTEQDIMAGRHEQDVIVVEKPGAITISIVSNSPYTIWLTTLSRTLHGPEGDLPIDRLEWRCLQGEWVPLGNHPGSLRAFAPGCRSIQLDLRLTIDYSDPPGPYRLETILLPNLL